MTDNYIFSGIGHALGKFTITNEDLEFAVKKGYLKGFNEDRLRESDAYKEFVNNHPDVSPFQYLAEYKMGFRTRNHVVPFPPTKTKLKVADNTLHLGVRAVQNALDDASIHPEDIDAWFVSTATPHEQAPGLGATLKCYFVNHSNQTPATTVTSACVGVNINLERSIEYFKCHPEAKHIVIAHSEVMSAIIQRKTDFVPFVTFADAAAAFIFSRVSSEKKEGIYSIVNHEDLFMIDFLGANKMGDLYMDAGIVKYRAIKNIISSSKESLDKAGWTLEDIDLMVPHQTGNAIVHGAAEKMAFPLEKVFQEVQLNHGNLSGASIPLGLSLLKKSGRLKPGMKILTATAGLGGEFGSYTYLVQDNINLNSPTSPDSRQEASFKSNISQSNDLKGKSVLVTGCTGAMGFEITKELIRLGCTMILQYNSTKEKKNNLEIILHKANADYYFYQSDFRDTISVNNFISEIKKNHIKIDYLIYAAAIVGNISRTSDISDEETKKVAQVNQYAPAEISKKLMSIISSAIIYIGSAAEEAQFPGFSSYIQSKRGLHGFAANYASELAGKKIRCIYYMPGITDSGMADLLDDKQKYNAMLSIGQEDILPICDVAKRIVRSLYIPKVQNVSDKYEGALLVRRDGYMI